MAAVMRNKDESQMHDGDGALAAGTTEQLDAERRRLTDALALAERDRQLLGYEIHDGVVQDMAAAAMLLESAGRQAAFAAPEAQESFNGGLKLLRESIVEARRLIRGLTTVQLDERGLVSALERLVEKFRTDHALPVSFECNCPNLELPASMQHLLLRIGQESLYNVWKHARASEALVRLAQSEHLLELSIADNGIGFDPSQIPPNHFGLEGIRARARVLSANLLFDTAPHHGTRIVVQLTPTDAA
jgi:signal transduction histidine kinase